MIQQYQYISTISTFQQYKLRVVFSVESPTVLEKQPRIIQSREKKQQQNFLLLSTVVSKSHPKLRVIGQGRRKSRLTLEKLLQQFHWWWLAVFPPCFLLVAKLNTGRRRYGLWLLPPPPQKQSKVTQLSLDMLCLQGLLCGGSFNIHIGPDHVRLTFRPKVFWH